MCGVDTSEGTLSTAGGATLGGAVTATLTESGGVVTVDLASSGIGAMGTVRFQVTTATTGVALPGQTLLLPSPPQIQNPLEGDAGVPTSVATGALALIDGNVVLSLTSSAVAAVVTCVVPYAPCPVSPADPSASLPSGGYASCILPSSGAGEDTVTVSRNGGTVTVHLGPQLSMYTTSSSYDVDVVAPGVATRTGSSSSTCGHDGTNASLILVGTTLFFDVGSDWNVDTIICTSPGNASFPADTGTPAVLASKNDAGATQTGRSVDACSDCRSTELCVASIFQGDECFALGNGSGSGSGSGFFDAGSEDSGPPQCRPGTMYDPGANCCEVDPETTYTCWPMPPSCTQGVTCDCASGVVLFACGEDAPCSVAGGSITCNEQGP